MKAVKGSTGTIMTSAAKRYEDIPPACCETGEGGVRFRQGIKRSFKDMPLVSVITSVYNDGSIWKKLSEVLLDSITRT